MIRVAIDARVVTDRYHGIGRYTYDIVRALAATERAEIVLIVDPRGSGRLPLSDLTSLPGVRTVTFKARIASIWEKIRWAQVLRALTVDVLFVPYHLAAPLRSQIPVVAMVHDCIFEQSAAFAPSRRMRRLYRFLSRVLIRRATAIVTPSAATGECVEAIYGVRPAGVFPHAVDPRFLRARSS